MEKAPRKKKRSMVRSPKRDLDKRITIQSGLMRAEILSGPFENLREVEFWLNRGSSFSRNHLFYPPAGGNNLLGPVVQIGLQILDTVETFQFAPIQG
jgi:hypothetical protein